MANDLVLLGNCESFVKTTRLLKDLIGIRNDGNLCDLGYVVAFVVNAGLACELGLKSILKENDISIRDHKLMKLYLSIPKEIQEIIENEMNNIYNIPLTNNDSWFIEQLDKHSNIFVQWRYYHEMDGGESVTANLPFIFNLVETIYKEASK